MRRTFSPYWIRLALPAGAAALYFAVNIYSAPESLRPVSVQMHLHGSMSEGSGSMRGANVQAKKIGLDVLWWTDHDWRMAYHTYADGYDFEVDDLSATRPVPYPAGTDPKLVEGEEMVVDLTPHPSNGPVIEPMARITAERAAINDEAASGLDIVARQVKSLARMWTQRSLHLDGPPPPGPEFQQKIDLGPSRCAVEPAAGSRRQRREAVKPYLAIML